MATAVATWAAPVAPAAALLTGGPFGGVAAAAALFLGLALAARRLEPRERSLLLAMALIGHCIALTAALAGHPWQIDAHMVFFAMLAIVATMGSIPALLLACAVTAVHHLSLSILLPALVYPAAGLGVALERTALHAVVVVFEAAVLAWFIRSTEAAGAELAARRAELARSAEASNELRQAAEDARARAEDLAERTRRDGEAAAGVFDAVLSRFAAGDLTARVEADVPPAYQPTKRSLNSGLVHLREAISAIRSGGDGVRSASDDILSSAEDLSRRTETQAANLEETAAAVEQITATVRAA
ncbi:uncharacterized membrane protein YhaH (DUF805 family), partial [Rubellimicrobium aerolatum]